MIDLLVIQPTPFCNIDCSYCYLPDRASTKKISSETLGLIIEKIISENLVGKELTIVWHAGEPLTLKEDYFVELLNKITLSSVEADLKIKHSIQTNGMLISQQWCDIFNENDIKIGLSIDGPEYIHDRSRKTRNGKGTFQKAMAGMDLLKKNNIPYHGIAVVSDFSLDFAKEIFFFFKDNGFYGLGLNIEEIEGQNRASSLNNLLSQDRIYTFLQKIYELYAGSDKKMRLREFDYALNAILQHPEIDDIKRLNSKSHQLTPFGIISIDCEGNFTTFSPELLGQKNSKYSDFILGNVYSSGFRQALTSSVFKNLSADIESGIKKCKKQCQYFHFCGGGAPANKLYENGSFNSTETMYCKYSIQTPLNIVLEDFEGRLGIK